MVQFLTEESFDVRTFFLGQLDADESKFDKTLISEQGLDVEIRSSDQPPKNILKKIGWYADATLNQMRYQDSKADTSEANSESLKLSDFHWPWAVTAMSESVKEFQPDAIIIEYIKLGYLLEALTAHQRKTIQCFVDTHDVLHLRCQQFKAQGFTHWIDIDRQEEANAVTEFDVVIAIQDEEAKIFRELSPNNQVIACGHKPAIVSHSAKPFVHANKYAVTVGYLASTNASNLEAIKGFLKEVWQPLVALNRLQLVIAGSICTPVKEFLSEFEISNVRMLGQIDDLAEFYDAVDLVVNPVEFGTGLKIKTVEAIGYGKPVLATGEGIAGLDTAIDNAIQNLEEDLQPAITVCETSESFQRELRSIVEQEQELPKRTAAAQQLSQALFSDQQIYSALKNCMLATDATED